MRWRVVGELREVLDDVVSTLDGVKWRLEEAMKAEGCREKDEILAIACMILVKVMNQLNEVYESVKTLEEVEGCG